MEMSGGDVEVEPYLDSRNTIGHGNHNPNSQRPKRFKIDIGGSGERWWCLWKVVWVCGSRRGLRAKFGKNMVKLGMLKLAWAVVPRGWAVVPLVVLSGSTAWMGGSTGRDIDCIVARFWGGN